MAATTPPPACVAPAQLGVVFIIDDSGSMGWTDPDKMRADAVSVGADFSRPGTVIAASKFSSTASQLVPPTVIDDTNRQGIKDAVSAGLRTSGGTMFNNAFLEAKRQLDSMPTTVDKKIVVFLSDGAPSDPAFTADTTLGVPIYTYGFGGAAGPVMQGIADRSGGTYTAAATSGDLMTSFVDLLSGIACDEAISDITTTIDPGKTFSVPFGIKINVQEFIGSAMWTSSQITTNLTRPNKSAFDTGTTLDGEYLNQQRWYSTFGAVRPPTGTWIANFTNIGLVPASVTIRIKRRTAPLALSCKTFKVTKGATERTVDANFTRSADPRVVYDVSHHNGFVRTFSTQTTSPFTLSDQIDYGMVVRVRIQAKIRNRLVGLPCVAAVNMGAIPKTTGTDSGENFAGLEFRDWIIAMAGDDTMSLLGGMDRAYGGDGNDTMDMGAGNDKAYGEGGDDTITGGDGSDLLDGGITGNDVFDGGTGNDKMYGWAGDDTFTGGTGHDTITAGLGNDTIDVSGDKLGVPYKDTVTCGAGNDTVIADKNRDSVLRDCENITWIIS